MQDDQIRAVAHILHARYAPCRGRLGMLVRGQSTPHQMISDVRVAAQEALNDRTVRMTASERLQVQQFLLDHGAPRPGAYRGTGPKSHRVQASYTIEDMAIIRTAAKAAGVTMAEFVSRTSLAAACEQLGME